MNCSFGHSLFCVGRAIRTNLPFVIPAKAGIQGLHGIACGDTSTALMPLAARRRVTFLSRQESNQRNAHPVASPALRAGSLRSSLKPGAAQLARIRKTIRAQTVLAHCSGLSGGARRAPTGERQNQQHLVQFAALIAALLELCRLRMLLPLSPSPLISYAHALDKLC